MSKLASGPPGQKSYYAFKLMWASFKTPGVSLSLGFKNMDEKEYLCNISIIMVNEHFALQIQEEWKTAEKRRSQGHFLWKTKISFR